MEERFAAPQDKTQHIESLPVFGNVQPPILKSACLLGPNILFLPEEQGKMDAFLYAQAVTVSLTGFLDSGSYHGPRWRMEPGDLFIPVDSIEEEATLTCDAKGAPPLQYR